MTRLLQSLDGILPHRAEALVTTWVVGPKRPGRPRPSTEQKRF